MKQQIMFCDRCGEQTKFIDEFDSLSELKHFELCDKCVYELKKFLNR